MSRDDDLSQPPPDGIDEWGLDLETSALFGSARIPDDGLCWWCRVNPATTAEHKYKKTDLRRMARDVDGRESADNLFRGGPSFTGVLKTMNKGKAVRWSVSMCKACNGGRDRDMDAAYDLFSDYLWNHQEELMRTRFLDWRHIYGQDWSDGARNTAGYYGKQLGCMLAQQHLPVPDALVSFLDDPNGSAEDLSFRVVRDPGRRMFHRVARFDGIDPRGYWLPGAPAELSADRTVLEGVALESYIGFMGINASYRRGGGALSSFFDQPATPVVKVKGASPLGVLARMGPGAVKRRLTRWSDDG